MSASTPEMQRPAATAATGSPKVERLGDDASVWDRFVRAAPDATFCHLAGWRRVLELCGHRAHYLYSSRGGEVTGVLPLAEIKSLLFGHSLISTPFCVYGGAVAASADDRAALEQHARGLAADLGVDYLELRNTRTAAAGDWLAKDRHVTFRKPISADDDENLRAVPRKQRAVIRKGIDAGLISETDANVDRFYDLFSVSVRNLGTPVLGKRYFATLLTEFGDSAEVLTITHGGKPVSSVMSFYFRDEVLPYYGGGTNDARDVKANDFMYWELMRRAGARGVRVFDFGRSKIGTGSYSFKKNWGFEPQPLPYQCHLVRATAMPDMNPASPKYRAMIATWQRLPVWVTRLIGPAIAPYLAW